MKRSIVAIVVLIAGLGWTALAEAGSLQEMLVDLLETHERMQDLVMRMNEKLKRRGKSFGELSAREFEDLADETVS